MGCGQSSEPGSQLYPAKQPYGKTKGIQITEDVLERYLQLEEEIALAEKNSPSMVLNQKRSQVTQLANRIAEQQELVRQLESETSREKRDLDQYEAGTKELFIGGQPPNPDDDMEREIQEYLDAINKEENKENGIEHHENAKDGVAMMNNQEIARNELNNLMDQHNNLSNEIRELEAQSAHLSQLYGEQEELLSRIFNGSYGSEEENRLEDNLDHVEEMRNRIVEANFKWRQAQLMVDYAYKQLDLAVSKWEEVSTIDNGHLEERYDLASVTRNNLVASSQNIQGAQRYLSNIVFPYCAPPEVETLNKATAYIFTDMQTPERHEHALTCYSVTWKRCGALLQWINQVVTQTITRDLDDINARVKDAATELRRERVRLIAERVKEVLGKDVQLEVNTDVNTDVDVALNFNELALTDGLDPNLLSALDANDLAALSELSAGELAPPPSDELVFGAKMEALKKEYEEDKERYNHIVAENQTRQKQTLEEKLNARKQRRARKNIEAKEKSALVA